jgi:GMP synthase-like glutamine amidotransferase
VLAGNAFTPFGLLEYEDFSAISMQFHPEFVPAYAQALIESRRARVPDPDAAIASLARPNDQALVAEWIRRFLQS